MKLSSTPPALAKARAVARERAIASMCSRPAGRARAEAILDHVEANPGATQQEILDALRASGLDTSRNQLGPRDLLVGLCRAGVLRYEDRRPPRYYPEAERRGASPDGP